ncbi:hypothetical protein HAX54_047074, partial [Datura stramonium]|nr:hypothetical protein [Datura stramonium]
MLLLKLLMKLWRVLQVLVQQEWTEIIKVGGYGCTPLGGDSGGGGYTLVGKD